MYQEIQYSLNRLEIDQTTFYIGFMKKASLKELTPIIEEIYEKRKSDFILKGFKMKIELDMGTIFHGELIFERLVNIFNQQNNGIAIQIVLMIISAPLGFVDGFIRIYYGQSFHGSSIVEIASFWIRGIWTSLLNFVIFLFYLRYMIDTRRKNYLYE